MLIAIKGHGNTSLEDMKMTTPETARRAEAYDDPELSYADYWTGRGYEHAAEVMAIRRLLRGRQFASAVDIGGGYGRLSVVLAEYAGKVTLVEPSSQQLDLAREFLRGYPAIDCRRMQAAELDFPDSSMDLAAMVRVLHHLPDPAPEIAEMARILRPGGYAIVEVANSAHAVNRARFLARRSKLPLTSIDLRSRHGMTGGTIPFVNHHPDSIARELSAAGLQIRQVLSVSNLRSPLIKRAAPGRLMLAAERAMQARLARIYFGPSIFFFLRKERQPADASGGPAG
ncbi:MAG: class I SAM-dependent methyltransferase [Streptosporangiaceae bacterium]